MVRPGPDVNDAGNQSGDGCDHSSVFGFPAVMPRCISALICIIAGALAKQSCAVVFIPIAQSLTAIGDRKLVFYSLLRFLVRFVASHFLDIPFLFKNTFALYG